MSISKAEYARRRKHLMALMDPNSIAIIPSAREQVRSRDTSYPFRQPERVFFNPYNPDEVWVSSFGNGMKVGSLTTPTSVEPATTGPSLLTVYPNPIGDRLNFTLREDAAPIATTRSTPP